MTVESKFLSEIRRTDGVRPSEVDVTVYECKTEGKAGIKAVVGMTKDRTMFVAEDGFLRKFNQKKNGRWDCQVLSALTF